MKVTTKDFQILKGENTFEFPTGITIIQGESGNGKSTVFYAILYALTNTSGVASCINWDAKSASVRIQNNGADITWIKTPTSSEYVDNLTGQNYVKASKLDARDLGDLGFYFDNKDNIVNMHHEWSVLFPYGQSDADMFRLFEDIFNISCSFKVIDEFKKDEQEQKQRINQINSDINSLTQTKTNINDILEKVKEQDVDFYISKLKTEESTLNQLNSDLVKMNQASIYTNKKIPKEFNLESLYQYNLYKEQLQKDYNRYQNLQKLASMKLPEEKEVVLPDTLVNPYFNDYTLLNTTLQNIKLYEQQLEMLDKQLEEENNKLAQIKVCPTCGHKLGE